MDPAITADGHTSESRSAESWLLIDAPEISDAEYDRLFRELQALKARVRVGASRHALTKHTHKRTSGARPSARVRHGSALLRGRSDQVGHGGGLGNVDGVTSRDFDDCGSCAR